MNIIDNKFYEWAQSKASVDAVINIYGKIRDIPYAIIPQLIDFHSFMEILRLKRGSCTPKHLLLCAMYEKLGMTVLYAVYPFRWDEIEIDYPPALRTLARKMDTSYHLACKVDIDNKLLLVDATLDQPLKKLGLPINMEWDGKSDTLLPVEPCGEEQLYHPSEAYNLRAQPDAISLAFYDKLNAWLDEVRGASG